MFDWTSEDNLTTFHLDAKTDLSPTKWAFITYVVNMDVGVSTYYNAMREGFASISAASPRNTAPLTSCGRVIMGAKHTWGAYAINGELDEIKFFYKDLTPAGESYCVKQFLYLSLRFCLRVNSNGSIPFCY